VINVTDYRTGEYPFPKHEINPKLKDHDWCVKFCQAMYAAWIRDTTALPYSKLNEFQSLRSYGAGTQDPEIYQDILLGESEKGAPPQAERQGWLNINWDIFSPAVKFKNVVIGIMEAQEHDIVATAVDPISGKEREEKKWELWLRAQYKKEIDYIDRNMRVKRGEDEFLPGNMQELQVYEELGGLKLKKEFAMERGIDYTLYISDWKEIKRKIFNDFMDIAIGASRDYVDKYTGKARCRYVNPSRLIIQYSKHGDHRNSEWAGEIIPMKIIDIRALAPEIPENELRELATRYQGINRNPSLSNWGGDDMRADDGGFKYDDFWIDVLDAEIKSTDIKYKQKRIGQNGNEGYYPQDDEDWGKKWNTETRVTHEIRGKTVYRAKWIIGTKKCFDYGYQFDIPRPGKKEVALSFHVYKLPGRSLISLMQPNLDQIQLTWLKLQNAIAVASPSGIAVEFSSLQNMVLGGKNMEPLQILEIRRGLGDIVYRATTHRGYVNSPHAGKPIQELEGGLGRTLEESVQLFELNFNFIRDLTGINEIADATTPNPNQPVGTSRMAIAATNNALKPMYSGYISIKEYMCRNIALRLQIIIKHSKQSYDVYYPVVGKSTLQILSIGSDVLDADMHIKIEARPNQEQRMALLETAKASTQADANGVIALEYGDYLMISRLVEGGNVRLAEAVMGYRSKQNKMEQLKIAQQNEEMATKRASTVQAEKAAQAEEAAQNEFERKKEFETHQTNEKIRLEEEKHDNKMEEIAATKTADILKEQLKPEKTQTTVPSNN